MAFVTGCKPCSGQRPFEILELPGGRLRLIEQFDLSYLPSAHFLGRAKHDDRIKWPWQLVLSVFADPLAGHLAKDSPFDAPLVRLTYSPRRKKRAPPPQRCPVRSRCLSAPAI